MRDSGSCALRVMASTAVESPSIAAFTRCRPRAVSATKSPLADVSAHLILSAFDAMALFPADPGKSFRGSSPN